ncbi:hypothetical protein [Streptomyces sp. NPDC050535]|uniref:hypothetical protein n=1 Tax=Streptomyces sp. NPDC050535 TaxID=3365626 RepID=UPI0037B8D5EF
MDVATEARDSGLYVLQQTGIQQWREDHGTWRAHGVRLDLMDGPRRLAVCKLEVVQREAEERAAAVVDGIRPWASAIQALTAVRDARSHLTMMLADVVRATEAEEEARPLEDSVRDALLAKATPDEIEQARHAQAFEWAGLPLARLIMARLRSELAARHLVLLATAPDLGAHPIHPAWEQPSPFHLPAGESTARGLARELLAAWAVTRDLRDPLITWAVTEAGVTRTETQQITSVSRSTINRLLPGA